jgi:hypothetical protein
VCATRTTRLGCTRATFAAWHACSISWCISRVVCAVARSNFQAFLTAENGTFGTRCLDVGCRVLSYTPCTEAIAASRPMCYAWLDVRRCTDIPWMYRVRGPDAGREACPGERFDYGSGNAAR